MSPTDAPRSAPVFAGLLGLCALALCLLAATGAIVLCIEVLQTIGPARVALPHATQSRE